MSKDKAAATEAPETTKPAAVAADTGLVGCWMETPVGAGKCIEQVGRKLKIRKRGLKNGKPVVFEYELE